MIRARMPHTRHVVCCQNRPAYVRERQLATGQEQGKSAMKNITHHGQTGVAPRQQQHTANVCKYQHLDKGVLLVEDKVQAVREGQVSYSPVGARLPLAFVPLRKLVCQLKHSNKINVPQNPSHEQQLNGLNRERMRSRQQGGRRSKADDAGEPDKCPCTIDRLGREQQPPATRGLAAYRLCRRRQKHRAR